MKVFAKSPAGYDDLRALPETVVGELIDGDLYASPRPRPAHAHVATALSGELYGGFGRGRGGGASWRILVEPELHLASDVLVPDIAGWRIERMPVLPEEAFFTVAPDWVCELLSPTTAKLDLVKKLPRYARAGVGHAWVLDPGVLTLEVFRRQENGWLLVAAFVGPDTVRAEPFDSFDLDLPLLWPVRADEG